MTEYAFILTGQYTPPGGSTQIFTLDGTLTPATGTTRQETYQHIVKSARERIQIPGAESVFVLFFSLEPNRLDGA